MTKAETRKLKVLAEVVDRARAIAREYMKKHGIGLYVNAPKSHAELDRWLRDGIEEHLTLDDGTPLATALALEAARQGPSNERKAEIQARAVAYLNGNQEPRWWKDMAEFIYFERCIFAESNRRFEEIETKRRGRRVEIGKDHHRQKAKNADGKTVDDFRERFIYWYGRMKKPNGKPSCHGAATMVAKESGLTIDQIRMAAKRDEWIG